MDFKYDRTEEIGNYIYYYKGDTIIAVYNPFVGFCKKANSNLNETLEQ